MRSRPGSREDDVGFRPARRERLADILYGQILEKILQGAFREGDRIPSETEISNAFQVSRPVVREALNRLGVDGILVARRGSGWYVAAVPPGRITDFARPAELASQFRTLEARLTFEPPATALAAVRRSPGELRRIRSAMEGLREAFRQEVDGAEEDFAFHMAIMEATGNPSFGALLRAIERLTRRTMTTALGLTRSGSRRRQDQVLAEHQAVLEAIENRDAERAEILMSYHLSQARERIKNYHLDV